MAKRCPKCNGKRFLVTVHVTQTWLVDEDDEFIDRVTDCDEVTHRADDDDMWCCDKCGYEAVGREFNESKES